MVDRTTIMIMGSVILAIGLGSGLLSGRLARSLATDLRVRFIRALILFGAFMMTLVGAMWIAGVGTK